MHAGHRTIATSYADFTICLISNTRIRLEQAVGKIKLVQMFKKNGWVFFCFFFGLKSHFCGIDVLKRTIRA